MNETQNEVVKEKNALIKDYIRVFEGDTGKRVLLDMIEQSKLLQPTYNKDRIQMFLNEGKREMVLYILDMISYDRDSLLDTIKVDRDIKKGKKHESDDELFDFFANN